MFILAWLVFSFTLHGIPTEEYTVSKIRIKSSLLGKDQFLQYYLHEAGDVFNEEMHARSLERIKEKLVADGYHDAIVSDMLSVDQRRSAVAITVVLEPHKRYTISQVDVQVPSDKELQRDLTIFLEGPLVGKPAQKDLIDEYGKRLSSLLLRKGYVTPLIHLSKERDVSKAHSKLIYKIIVDERQEIVFKGNSFFTSSELLDDIYSLKEQGVALPASLLAQDIEDLYKSKGFCRIKITVEENPSRITFVIEEGPRHSVASVTIKESFTDSDALGIIQSLENNLVALTAYDESEVDSRLAQAADELSQLGFWYVVFDKRVECLSHAKISLLIAVRQSGSENIEKTLITGIDIPNHAEFLSQGPFEKWKNITKPMPLRPSDVEEQRRWLLRTLRNQGYLTASVHHELIKSDAQERLVWNIDHKSGLVYFGPIRLSGLYKMKPRILLRELCFKEGDVWNTKAIEESVANLKRLSMFESLAVCPEEIVEKQVTDSQTISVRPILIKCAEEDPFEVLTRFGLQFVSKSFTNLSWSTWKLGGSFVWKNPAGIADKFIVDADWTRYTLNLAAGYEVPWIGSIPVRTQFRIYSDRFDQPLISSNHVRLYKESHDGACVTFNHYNPLWSTCVRTGFEFNKLTGISQSVARVIQFEPTLVDRRTPYIYVEPSVTFEHFDERAAPTKGYFTTLSLKAMVPLDVTDGWFLKAQLEQSFFYPIFQSLIGAFRWRFGHIFNARFSTILPTERFYLGGANSLRGYETNMVPPLNDFMRDSGLLLWVPVGGKTMLNINTELRFPLYKMLSGVIFTDMGILTQDKIADIAANRWLGASGFGLRFGSPFGPIRFDIGWKWHKRDPKDRSYAFFLTFGHAF